jgi:hypothetical protein
LHSIIAHRQNCICRGAEDDTPITGVSRRRLIIHYAVAELRARRSINAWMQVGDEQFNNEEINRLYDDDDNPLRTPSSN